MCISPLPAASDPPQVLGPPRRLALLRESVPGGIPNHSAPPIGARRFGEAIRVPTNRFGLPDIAAAQLPSVVFLPPRASGGYRARELTQLGISGCHQD